jgi:hypothetical protein
MVQFQQKGIAGYSNTQGALVLVVGDGVSTQPLKV